VALVGVGKVMRVIAVGYFLGQIASLIMILTLMYLDTRHSKKQQQITYEKLAEYYRLKTAEDQKHYDEYH